MSRTLNRAFGEGISKESMKKRGRQRPYLGEEIDFWIRMKKFRASFCKERREEKKGERENGKA